MHQFCNNRNYLREKEKYIYVHYKEYIHYTYEDPCAATYITVLNFFFFFLSSTTVLKLKNSPWRGKPVHGLKYSYWFGCWVCDLLGIDWLCNLVAAGMKDFWFNFSFFSEIFLWKLRLNKFIALSMYTFRCIHCHTIPRFITIITINQNSIILCGIMWNNTQVYFENNWQLQMP